MKSQHSIPHHITVYHITSHHITIVRTLPRDDSDRTRHGHDVSHTLENCSRSFVWLLASAVGIMLLLVATFLMLCYVVLCVMLCYVIDALYKYVVMLFPISSNGLNRNGLAVSAESCLPVFLGMMLCCRGVVECTIALGYCTIIPHSPVHFIYLLVFYLFTGPVLVMMCFSFLSPSALARALHAVQVEVLAWD